MSVIGPPAASSSSPDPLAFLFFFPASIRACTPTPSLIYCNLLPSWNMKTSKLTWTTCTPPITDLLHLSCPHDTWRQEFIWQASQRDIVGWMQPHIHGTKQLNTPCYLWPSWNIKAWCWWVSLGLQLLHHHLQTHWPFFSFLQASEHAHPPHHWSIATSCLHETWRQAN